MADATHHLNSCCHVHGSFDKSDLDLLEFVAKDRQGVMPTGAVGETFAIKRPANVYYSDGSSDQSHC